ncbi:oxidoreductase [Actinomycetes bacterium]|jgi:glycine/D-amino acid oxidase-like deaminating enzyme|nr:oxidoreductase [Actinomycetes bacterium]
MTATAVAFVGDDFPYGRVTSQEAKDAISKAKPKSFWLDSKSRPKAAPGLAKDISTGLVIVGGGFTGLWTAINAKIHQPNLDVVLIDSQRIGDGAAGRNGGFVSASLTHGFPNGFGRWEHELTQLVALGHENLDEIEDFLIEHKIDADFEWFGEFDVAITQEHADELREMTATAKKYGEDFTFFDAQEFSKYVKSPLYKGAMLDADCALVNPAKLAWGLRKVALKLGVEIYENSPVLELDQSVNGVKLKTALGSIKARRCVLATGAFPSLVPKVNRMIAPVYDYVLVTEPLTEEQKASIGWNEPFGCSDAFNQFHYFRLTKDGRMLWGGYDAVYHYGNEVIKEYEQSDESFAMLAEHLYRTFPSLRGIGFSHKWGGAIDTCSRFTPFWGTSMRGKVAYVAGFTGLGVGSSRFAALTLLDLVYGRKSERTKLSMVRTKPLPFPPEPFKSWVINLTRWSIDRADHNGGKRNLWLKLLDWLGLGFDS